MHFLVFHLFSASSFQLLLCCLLLLISLASSASFSFGSLISTVPIVHAAVSLVTMFWQSLESLLERTNKSEDWCFSQILLCTIKACRWSQSFPFVSSQLAVCLYFGACFEMSVYPWTGGGWEINVRFVSFPVKRHSRLYQVILSRSVPQELVLLVIQSVRRSAPPLTAGGRNSVQEERWAERHRLLLVISEAAAESGICCSLGLFVVGQHAAGMENISISFQKQLETFSVFMNSRFVFDFGNIFNKYDELIIDALNWREHWGWFYSNITIILYVSWNFRDK